MSTSELIVYGIAGINSIALLIGSNMLAQVNRKLDKLTDSDERLVKDIHDLDKRVTRMETVNDERRQVIDEIKDGLVTLTNEFKAMKEKYDENIRIFFETYELKKKE